MKIDKTVQKRVTVRGESSQFVVDITADEHGVHCALGRQQGAALSIGGLEDLEEMAELLTTAVQALKQELE